MWVYCTQPKKTKTETAVGCVPGIAAQSPKNNILFEYQPTRNGDHAARFFGDYSGYFVCDGFDGYNKLKKAVRLLGSRQKKVRGRPSE